MKVLHTADWHLNDKLGRQDRTEHLRRRVEQVAGICDREAVDVLIVAGDLFSELATAVQVTESFKHLRRTFASFFARGGTVLGVTGNHDQDGRVRPFIELARSGMDLAEPPKNRGDRFLPSKMYLLDTTFVGRVHDLRDKFDVQFVLLPFPSHSRLLTGMETATTAGQLHRSIQDTVGSWVRDLPQIPGYDPRLRTVLVAHLHVSGSDVGRGMFRVSEENDIILDAAALPTGFDYIALGHVHKPQCLRGLPHVRYAGSLDRMDFSERDEDKGVVLVDIGPNGRRCDPVPIPIEPTALVDVSIDDPHITPETLAAQVPNAKEALVRIEVGAAATADASETLNRAIREALPNVTRIGWQPPVLEDAPAARVVSHGGDIRKSVIDYLERRIPADDPQRQDLLALAARFLDQGGAL
jgi:exonuclease SbcD